MKEVEEKPFCYGYWNSAEAECKDKVCPFHKECRVNYIVETLPKVAEALNYRDALRSEEKEKKHSVNLTEMSVVLEGVMSYETLAGQKLENRQDIVNFLRTLKVNVITSMSANLASSTVLVTSKALRESNTETRKAIDAQRMGVMMMLS